jgi:hypothetical protein
METRKMALALVLAAALAATGCTAGVFAGGAAAAAGAATGAYVYEEGKLKTTYDRSLTDVYDATVASLNGMDIPVQKVKKDEAGAEIEAKRADGTGVSVGLEPATPESTKASIRVGLWGDEDVSKAIANNVSKRLEEMGRGAKPPAKPQL